MVKPWVTGIIDGLSASNLIRSSNIENKNRLAFIVLDSTLEISFKNFIFNVKKLSGITESTLRNREPLNKIVKKHTDFDQDTWDEVEYFYKIRTGLYHADSEKTVTNTVISDFQDTVEFFVNNLFSIKCLELLPLTHSLLTTNEKNQKENGKIPINKIKEKINVVIVAVGESQSNNAEEIIGHLHKKGFKSEITKTEINRYLNHHYKHYFYLEEYWRLSEAGQDRYNMIEKAHKKEEI